MIAPAGYEFARPTGGPEPFDHAAPVGSSVGMCGQPVDAGQRTTSSMRVCRVCSRMLAARAPERQNKQLARQRGMFSQDGASRAAAFHAATGGDAIAPTPVDETPWCMGPMVGPDVDGSGQESCRYRSAIVVRAEASYPGRAEAYFCSNLNHRTRWVGMLELRGFTYRVETATPDDLVRLREARRARRPA